MFEEYRLKVLETYREKKAKGELSLNLTHSSPANLRRECVSVFNRRYSKKDDRILISFFDLGDEEDYERTIRRFDRDKFIPLNRFLNGEIRSTDERNIELLAWLIDFQPRPYSIYQSLAHIQRGEERFLSPPEISGEALDVKSTVDQTDGSAVGVVPEYPKGIADDEREPQIVTLLSTQPKGKELLPGKARSAVMLFLVLVLTGTATYLLMTNMTKPVLTGQEKCMYWANDHYEAISCNQKKDDATIYALDSVKLSGFRQITDPDTITQKALKNVWYLKINNQIEYFTAAGFHPVHTERRLKPITEYIINKYVPQK